MNFFAVFVIRVEMVLKFGIHKNWERRNEQAYIEKIILNPYTAKTFSQVIQEISICV